MATDPTGGRSVPLAERVKNILVQPKPEWARIAAEPATIGGIYRGYVAILAAIPPLALLIGTLLFGSGSAFGVTFRPSIGAAVTNAVVSYLLALAGVYVLALIIEALAPTFGGTKDRVQAFKVAAYSSTPGWVAGVLMVLPALAPLAGLAGLYGLYLLYLGLPQVMRSPQDRSAGYIVAVIVAAILVFIVMAAITGALVAALTPAAGPGTISVDLPA
jgi:hypothetical protein